MIKLSIVEYADFELLEVIEDNQQKRNEQIAEILEADKRSVGSRLAWMSRFGLIKRTIAMGWVLTPKGKAVLTARREDLMTVRQISESASRDPTIAWVTKREFLRNIRR